MKNKFYILGIVIGALTSFSSYGQIASHVVISEVYGGGGNTGAPYTNDFIELYNPTPSSVSLSGWSVQYATASGSSWAVTNLSGSIASYSYYLIQEDAGSAPSTALPTPDAIGTTSMSATAGKIALVNNATALSGNCPLGASVIDFVGYGTSADCSENAYAPAPSNTNSIQRKSGSSAPNRGSGFDADQNSTDFATAAPTPQNSVSAAQPPSLALDYFRTKASGNWNDISTWESSSTGGSTDWLSASIVPDFNAATISILGAHTVTTTADILIDQTVVQSGGVLNINPLITLNLNDGTGTDLTVNSGGKLVLKSDATGAANFGNMGSATIIDNGNVTHERYLSAPSNGSGGRSWRLLTSPLKASSNNSVFYNWQNNGINDGTGLEIWGPSGTGAMGNGLANGAASSLRTYDAVTNQYVAVTNSRNEPLFDANGNKAFLAFVSGHYGSGNISSGASSTNSDAIGSLITGTQNYNFTPPTTANIYQLIGNPYACPIDFDKVYLNGGTANINRMFWIVDPNLSSVGAYVTVTYTGGSYITSAGAQNQYIQSGQAFFVEGNNIGNSSTIAIEEADKETTAPQTAVFRSNGGSLETFRTKLYKTINGNPTLLDGAVVAGHQNSSNAINGEDGVKFGNFNENISIYKGNNTYLAVEGRQLLDDNDTVNVAVSNMQQTNYQLVLEPNNMNVPGLTAVLIDNFTNTTTPVSLTASTTYSFSVTGSSASTGNNRFKVVFTNTAPLAVKFVNVNAQKKENTVDVNWTVSNEEGTKNYEVERSEDGKTFSKIASLAARYDDQYSYNDATPFNGNNFYRIKAIARSEKGIYSNIVRVNRNATTASISTYPNPVKDGNIQINVSNLEKGAYTISIYNIGQKMAEKTMNYDGGSSQIRMNVQSLAAGIYHLSLMNDKGEKIAEQKIVKQ